MKGAVALGFTMLGLMLPVAAPAATAGAPKQARCSIWSSNAIQYDGPCRFTGEGEGSFVLTFPRDAGDLTLRGVDHVRVRIMRPGVALVSVGDDDYWGNAVRSKRDPACWEAEYFRVCAY